MVEFHEPGIPNLLTYKELSVVLRFMKETIPLWIGFVECKVDIRREWEERAGQEPVKIGVVHMARVRAGGIGNLTAI